MCTVKAYPNPSKIHNNPRDLEKTTSSKVEGEEENFFSTMANINTKKENTKFS